jgi:hypothetical protein
VAERIPGVIYEVARRVKKTTSLLWLTPPLHDDLSDDPQQSTLLKGTPRGGQWGKERDSGEVREKSGGGDTIAPRLCPHATAGKPLLVEELGERGQVKVWKMRGSGCIIGMLTSAAVPFRIRHEILSLTRPK